MKNPTLTRGWPFHNLYIQYIGQCISCLPVNHIFAKEPSCSRFKDFVSSPINNCKSCSVWIRKITMIPLFHHKQTSPDDIQQGSSAIKAV